MGIVTVARVGDPKLAPPLIAVRPTTKLSSNSGVLSSTIPIRKGAEFAPSAIISVPCKAVTSLADAVMRVIIHDTLTWGCSHRHMYMYMYIYLSIGTSCS